MTSPGDPSPATHALLARLLQEHPTASSYELRHRLKGKYGRDVSSADVLAVRRALLAAKEQARGCLRSGQEAADEPIVPDKLSRRYDPKVAEIVRANPGETAARLCARVYSATGIVVGKSTMARLKKALNGPKKRNRLMHYPPELRRVYGGLVMAAKKLGCDECLRVLAEIEADSRAAEQAAG